MSFIPLFMKKRSKDNSIEHSSMCGVGFSSDILNPVVSEFEKTIINSRECRTASTPGLSSPDNVMLFNVSTSG